MAEEPSLVALELRYIEDKFIAPVVVGVQPRNEGRFVVVAAVLDGVNDILAHAVLLEFLRRNLARDNLLEDY